MRENSPVVLIADDEEQVGLLASISLRKLGFITLLANNAGSALGHWQQHQSEVDILLTDLAMPDMRGDLLAAKLLKEKPSLRVVFMSGSPLKSDETDFRFIEGENLLQKPFSRDTLIALFTKHLQHFQ